MNPNQQLRSSDPTPPRIGAFNEKFVCECIAFVKAIAQQTGNDLFAQEVIVRAREIVKGEK